MSDTCKAGLYIVDEIEAKRISLACEQGGWRLFALPAGIGSKDDFFEGVRSTFPLDPPLQSNRSWDALADSLWAGLDGLQEGKLVIVWPNAFRMRGLAPKEFDVATSVLSDLCVSLADIEATVGNTKQLLVLQVE